MTTAQLCNGGARINILTRLWDIGGSAVHEMVVV